MLPLCGLPCQFAMGIRMRRANKQSHLPNKLQLMWNRLFPGDPGDFMRNRYVVAVAAALMAVFLVAATGCTGNPEKAKKKYLESGLSYVDKKQYDAAVIQFKKALQVDPNYAEAQYQLGVTYLRQQRVKEAYAALNQAAKLDPKNI